MTLIEKNQKFKLSDYNSNMESLTVGLGWKINSEGENFDLDVAAFMLKTDNSIRDRKDFVYYNNLNDNLGVLTHSGDNVSGGEGDSEQITVNFKNIPDEIGHISFVATIANALEKQLTFGKVQDAYIRVIDKSNNKEIVRYNLGTEFFAATSVLVGDLAKKENEWYFDAVGVAFSGGLHALSQDFDLKLK